MQEQWRRPGKKERQDETQFTTKVDGKTIVWVSVIQFCKIFIPSYALDGLLCFNCPFLFPNCMTLWITLLNFVEFQQLRNKYILCCAFVVVQCNGFQFSIILANINTNCSFFSLLDILQIILCFVVNIIYRYDINCVWKA